MARRKSTQSGIPNFDETIADIRNRVILSVAPLQKLQDIDGCFYQIGDLGVGMVAILKDTAYTTEFLKITLPLIRQFDLSLNELLVSAYGNTQAFSDIDFSLEPANDGEPQLPLYNLISRWWNDRTQAGYPVWVSCLFFSANFFADFVAFAQICKKRHDRLIQYILKKWVFQLCPFLLRCVFCGTCRFFDRKGARTKRA